MRHATATRLAQRAVGRGRRAGWAVRRLVRAGDGGDAAARDAVWRAWLAEPWEVWWEALSRWRQPSTGPDREVSLVALGEGSAGDPAFRAALVEAAARSGHPIAEMARAKIAAAADDQGLVDAVCCTALVDPTGGLLAFCAEQGLAPGELVEPADRAVFLLLAGRHDRYRATDPDGSLLGQAYVSVPKHLHRRIQRVVAEMGDVGLVRVLTATGGAGRLSGMTSDEVRDLARKLAGGREWEELWWVAQQLPLPDAVDAVRLVVASSDDSWRPTGDAAGALFEQLAGADGDETRAASRALAEATDTISLRHRDGQFVGGAFSPNGRQMAAAIEKRGGPERPLDWSVCICVFELPSGRLLQRCYHHDLTTSLCLAYRGDELLAWREFSDGEHESGVIERHVGNGVEKIYEESFPRLEVAACAGGFVGVERRRRDPALWFFTVDGGAVTPRRVMFDDDPSTAPHRCHPRTVVYEIGSGRLVFGGTECLMVIDAEPGRPHRLLAHTKVSDHIVTGACMPDPDHLVTASGGGVRRWRLDGGGLTLEAEVRNLRSLVETSVVARTGDPIAIRRRGELAVRSVAGPVKLLSGSGEVVRYLDAESLADVREPRELDGRGALGLWSSPTSRSYAVGGDGGARVVMGVHSDTVVALASRPLADTTPADLATVRAELTSPHLASDARPFLELLHACLEYRFGAEVALGRGVPVAGEHDIALGGERR